MRTALVTGASKGIGKAIAEQLEQAGCSVLTPSRSELDLSSDASTDAYLASLDRGVDILVNDAGINLIADLALIDDQDVHRTMQINLIAPFRLIRAITGHMCTKRFGRIVNISSMWSVVSRPGRINYAMSKAALNGLTRSAAVELAPFNILVNAVAPGYVLTDLTRQNVPAAELEKIGAIIPMRRLAEPDEIAHVVAFLCSDQNTYLTGQTLIVDGGYTCL